jgi:hypothetical protein
VIDGWRGYGRVSCGEISVQYGVRCSCVSSSETMEKSTAPSAIPTPADDPDVSLERVHERRSGPTRQSVLNSLRTVPFDAILAHDRIQFVGGSRRRYRRCRRCRTAGGLSRRRAVGRGGSPHPPRSRAPACTCTSAVRRSYAAEDPVTSDVLRVVFNGRHARYSVLRLRRLEG